MRDLIITAAVSFLVGVLIVFLLLASVSSIRRRSGERRSAGEATPRERRRVPLQKPKTSTVVLVFIAVFILLFTGRMIDLYERTGGIPDTLVVSVFSICGGECGALSWIRTSKERHRERKWEVEDRRRMEDEARRQAQPTDNLEPSFSFYALANRARRGINKKYRAVIKKGGEVDYPVLGKDDPITKGEMI